MLTVVTYDIPVTRRRNKIAKILLDYGERVQYSVFECNLTVKQQQTLLKELKQVIDDEEDSIRFYRLCATCAPGTQTLGTAQPPAEDPQVYIL